METAEEFLKRETETFDDTWRTRDSTIRALLKRFAKLHVEAFREELLKNDCTEENLELYNSILNDYPLTNIK